MKGRRRAHDIVVFKLGGSLEERGLTTLTAALAEATQAGVQPIVVHGAGPQITRALATAGLVLPFIDGQRQTTAEAMGVVARTLAHVNGALTTALAQHGHRVVSVHAHRTLLHAVPTQPHQRTGVVTAVDPTTLCAYLEADVIPIISPVAFGAGLPADAAMYNVNADLAAAAIAGQYGARKIIFFTDVAGIFSDWDNRIQMYDTDSAALRMLLASGCFSSGMIPKVRAVQAGLAAGVEEAYVIDGQDVDSVLWALHGARQGENENSLRRGTRVRLQTGGDAK